MPSAVAGLKLLLRTLLRSLPSQNWIRLHALGYVVSLNLRRRHLDESQRAMVAARIAKLPKGSNQHAQICAPSQETAGEMLKVGRRSVQHAREVLDEGAPELISASGLKREDDDLTVIASAAAAMAFKRNFDARFSSGAPLSISHSQ